LATHRTLTPVDLGSNPSGAILTENIMSKENCVICKEETNVDVITDVSHRPYYVEGVGQLCKQCWISTYVTEKLVYYEE